MSNVKTTDAPSDLDTTDETVAVVGAGTMGRGIAVAFAVGGCSVRLYDPDPDALASARDAIKNTVLTLVEHESHALDDAETVLNSITYKSSLQSTVIDADMVVEAVPEDISIKTEALKRIERYALSDTIIATNTSSLSITKLGEALNDPVRFLGTHWFHPPHIVPAVEIVYGEQTADESVSVVDDLLERIGKTPVVVEKDIPGFIGNRIQSAMAHEAWSLLNDGVASAEDIDTAVKGTFGFRLPALGVFEKGDHSGLDIHAKVLDQLLSEINQDTTPSESLLRLIKEGRHGVKTGKGVYDWTDVDVERVVEERDRQLLSLLRIYQQRDRPAPLPSETDQ